MCACLQSHVGFMCSLSCGKLCNLAISLSEPVWCSQARWAELTIAARGHAMRSEVSQPTRRSEVDSWHGCIISATCERAIVIQYVQLEEAFQARRLPGNSFSSWKVSPLTGKLEILSMAIVTRFEWSRFPETMSLSRLQCFRQPLELTKSRVSSISYFQTFYFVTRMKKAKIFCCITLDRLTGLFGQSTYMLSHAWFTL